MCDLCLSHPCRPGCPNEPEDPPFICPICEAEVDEKVYMLNLEIIGCDQCVAVENYWEIPNDNR